MGDFMTFVVEPFCLIGGRWECDALAFEEDVAGMIGEWTREIGSDTK